ncbi:MAG: helix-turn-helix transcriptional regulator [Ruminococcus sp.]|nr:helix-turn-helix transcriptional regulator [Ruminococcus sp.]
MTFGEKIKAERKKLGLTQIELGERIGVTNRVITSYENGKSFPRTREAYKKIADALGVNVNYLLSDDDAFVMEAEEQFGYRGKKGAEKLLAEVTGLFAGGEMAEEDMDELMLGIQEAYVEAKKRNKKYTPKKYQKKSE